MKKIIMIFFFFAFLFTSDGYSFILELIDKAVDFATGQMKEIKEQVFRNTMIAQTVQTVTILKQNYEQSVKFYNEIQQLQENLYGISEEAKQKFLERLNYTVKDVQKEIEQKIKELDEESKKIFDTKIVDYIKSNWDLGNKIVQTVESRKQELQKKVNKLSNIGKTSRILSSEKEKEEARAEVEQIKNELLAMQIEIQNQQNLLLLKIFELQNNQLQQMLIQKQASIERQKAYAVATKKFLEEKRKKFSSNENYIKSYPNIK